MDFKVLAIAKKYTDEVVTETGLKGKSAYQYALEGGYTGTEEDFKKSMAIVPSFVDRLTSLENKLSNLNYQSDTDTYIFHSNLDVEGDLTEKNV
jgi:hypothetical protein